MLYIAGSSFINTALVQAPEVNVPFWWMGVAVQWRWMGGVGIVLYTASGDLRTTGAAFLSSSFRDNHDVFSKE